jgi:hypothetical protein
MLVKIEHQSNAKIFFLDRDNFTESKPKQIMMINSKSIKY